MDPLAPGLNLRSRLLASGVTDRELRRLRRTGVLTTVRPGAYVTAEGASHLLAVRATAAALGPGSVISHASAAVVHGLPLWDVPLDRVHVTRDRTSGARRNELVHLHAAALYVDEVVMVGGLVVTSLARTIVDLARSQPIDRALVPADAALHRGAVTRAQLEHALDRAARRPGNSRARRLVAFADGCAESPGESLSRLAIQRSGLPAPELQHEVRTAGGRLLGRVDFWWEEFCAVGEFDGRVKYGRLLRPGQDPGEAVFVEKRREDAIRAEGPRFVRWTWPDLTDFAPVAARIRG